MRSHLQLVLAVVALSGCPRGAEVRDLPRTPTAGEVLVRTLPAAADHCIVARPGRLSPARRRQLAPLTSTTAFAWDSDAPIAALAEVRQDGRGAPATVIHLRASDVGAVRGWLEQSAPFRVRWLPSDVCDETPERPVCRGWRADAPDGRTVRLRRGTWRTGSTPTGVRGRCEALAARFPGAHEVGVHAERGWRGAWDIGESGPSSFREIALLPWGEGRRGVRWREVLTGLGDVPAGMLLELAEGTASEPPFVESAARRYGPAAGSGGIESAADYRWEDLALALEDARRLARAASAEAADSVPMDPARVAVEERETLARQLELHRRAAERTGERARLRALLERGCAAHPEDPELAELLAAELVHAGDGRSLVALAGEWSRSEGGPRWALLERQGRALAGDGLAEALVLAGVASARRARVAAATLATPTFARAYEGAEGAWQTSEALRRATPRLAPSRAVLPQDGLLETLVALAEGTDEDAADRAVLVRMTRPARGDPEAVVRGTARTRLYRWREGDRVVHVGATRTDDPLGLSTLAALLAQALEGRCRLRVAVVAFGGDAARPDGLAAVEGEADGAGFRLRRASRGPRWETVSRWLAEPFAALPERTFPRPRFSVVALSAGEAADVARRAALEPALECARDGATLSCAVSPERDRVRRAWYRSVPAGARF